MTVNIVIAEYLNPKVTHKTIPTVINSTKTGTISKTVNLNKNSIPFAPLSIALVNPPVCLFKWKVRDKLCMCLKAFKAAPLTALCATLAKTNSLASSKKTCPKRAKAYEPMTNQSKLKFIEFLSETKSTALPYKNGVYTLTSVAVSYTHLRAHET